MTGMRAASGQVGRGRFFNRKIGSQGGYSKRGYPRGGGGGSEGVKGVTVVAICHFPSFLD